MTEANARALLRDWPSIGGLETWIAQQPWKAVPGGWTADGKVRGRSFLSEQSGSGLRVTAIRPTGGKSGEWAAWTVTG